MDWKLTKSLYILVFLLINVALLMMYYNKQQEDIEEIENTPGVLEETDIDMSQLPEHQPEKLNILAGEKLDFNEVDEISDDEVEITNSGHIIHEEFDAGDEPPEMVPMTERTGGPSELKDCPVRLTCFEAVF